MENILKKLYKASKDCEVIREQFENAYKYSIFYFSNKSNNILTPFVMNEYITVFDLSIYDYKQELPNLRISSRIDSYGSYYTFNNLKYDETYDTVIIFSKRYEEETNGFRYTTNGKTYTIEYNNIQEAIKQYNLKKYLNLKSDYIILFKDKRTDKITLEIMPKYNNCIIYYPDETTLTICKALLVPNSKKFKSHPLTIEQINNIEKQTDFTQILQNKIKEFNLEEVLKDVDFYINTKSLENIYRLILNRQEHSLIDIDEDLNSIRTRYSDTLHQKDLVYSSIQNLKEKIKNTLTNVNYNKNYISNVSLKTEGSYLYLNIYFKFLPVLFIDLDLMKSLNKQYTYGSNQNIVDMIDKVDNEKYFLLTYPTVISVSININNFRYSLKTNQLPYKYYNYSNEYETINAILEKGSYNGHAFWSDGGGCLGTFGIPLSDAVNELNINKIIAILTQYLQSISPADYAGKATIKHPVLVDWENKKLISHYAIPNQCEIDLNNIIYEGEYYGYKTNE